MAVKTFCDKCLAESSDVYRYSLSLYQNEIPKKPKTSYGFITNDGVAYHGPQYNYCLDLCNFCYKEWAETLKEVAEGDLS